LKGELAAERSDSSSRTSGGGAAGAGRFSSKGDLPAVRAESASRASSPPAPVPSPSSSPPSKKSSDVAAALPKHEVAGRHGSHSETEDPSSDVPRFVGLTPLEIVPEPFATPDPAGAFRAAVEKKHSQLGAVLDDASIRLDGKTVLVFLDPPSAVTERRLAEPAMAKVLEEAAVAVLGRGARVAVESVSPPAGDLTAAAANADPETLEREHLKMKVATDERVKRMMDLFGGEIADVKRDGGPDRAKGR